MAYAELKMEGKTFVLVPKNEYRRLAGNQMPPMPDRNEDGTYPALAASRVNIARNIIRRRQAAGLSQKALAEAAGIRAETLNRLERAKVSADLATIEKIERVLAGH